MNFQTPLSIDNENFTVYIKLVCFVEWISCMFVKSQMATLLITQKLIQFLAFQVTLINK